MPFSLPFNNKIEHYDLIFGLGTSISLFQAELLNNQKTTKIYHDLHLLQFVYNFCEKVDERTKAIRAKRLETQFINSYKYIDKSKKNYPIEIIAQFKFLNEHTRKNIQHNLQLYLDYVEYMKKPDQFEDRALKYSTKYHAYFKSGECELFDRRKSKMFLNYQLLIRNGKIHFVLDGLDLEIVPKKIPFSFKKEHMSLSIENLENIFNENLLKMQDSEKLNLKAQDITASELRWVYRNRKHPKVEAGIQFWKNKVPCEAPWNMPLYKNLWLSYHPKNVY
ncbi:hypothetical protein [Fluviispira multicolorata]|uniref:Uncharacterized protein n=1 Tax=Fluviispira multicolorata TaxID=2654512 RepID=A0A833JDU1_9BACT|nr:hypothetical protein [Fluviispira multicolorata]KAB8029065.1 hypothetical protein GCL57_11030 [Fluviispira multicolorata]